MPGPQAESLAPFFARIQKECLPGVWSKGVALARDATIHQDSANETEIVLRVSVKDHLIAPKVTLWPEDDDSYCDCGDRNEICAHIVAAVIALKSGKPLTSSSNHADEARPASGPRLSYRFTREESALSFDRVVVYATREVPLNDTLVSLVGGIASGRITSPPIPATREDFAVDAALGVGPRRGKLERTTLQKLLAALSQCAGVTLDGQPVTTSGKVTGFRAKLTDVGEGFRLSGQMDAAISEVFTNGAALCEQVLRPVELPVLSQNESQFLNDRIFKGSEEIALLVAEILPSLEKKLPLEIATARLPQAKAGIPEISLKLERLDENTLIVVPSIGYANQAGQGEILVPDHGCEKMLARKLQTELHLNPGQPVRFSGQAAVDFVMRLTPRSNEWRLHGEGVQSFAVTGELKPQLIASENGMAMSFAGANPGASADPARVFQAWQTGEEYVPLLGGGWAPLPRDWLEKYGRRISALLQAQSEKNVLPRFLLPELAQLCDELNEPIPEKLRNLRLRLENAEGIPEAKLPGDLRAELRHYQIKGINWLCFLRDSGLGAMLADDMGLGKTLQALCAIRGRTLVVMPTSVLSSWSGQISQFRPALSVATYYGPKRELDLRADVTLTTYALLRLDRERLTSEHWDTIILDEAQTIKNPDSQAARAAHSLRGDFRIALSGTPVENKLDDLWSQFQFLNPGLLGSRETFQDTYSAAISRGDGSAAQRLRARIRPFLLRRLKKEVAPELPPRTETVLHCELSPSEQELYDSILAASRKEVLEKLEQGAGVFAALEMLLRLRQACCSPALVPGQRELSSATSTKLELLMETLDESVGLGHRALIFSQWTSYLDLIEPELRKAGVSFVRLDGTTKDRQGVVAEFQRVDGPSVMLISLKAGGVGLTLTAADHIFLMDPWWNPAVEDQAADRAHRIGQENPVLIHRLVAKGTVEDRILDLQKRKLAIAGAVLEGSGAALTITKEDILELLR